MEFAESKKVVGPIYPVLEDSEGNIIDGLHRLKSDPKWPVKVVNVKDAKMRLLMRIHANNHRRTVTWMERKAQINQLAKFLKDDGLKEHYSDEIARLTGFSRIHVIHLLDPEFKNGDAREAGLESAKQKKIKTNDIFYTELTGDIQARQKKRLKDMMAGNGLKCPDGHEGKLVWSCCGKPLEESLG